MKKIMVMVYALPLLVSFSINQDINEKKMARDLEIAKNILATLVKSGSDSWFGSRSIEASYIKDYGVVFTIPEHLVYFNSGNGFISIPDMPPIPEVAPLPDFDFQVDIDIDEDKILEEQEKARVYRGKAREERDEVRAEMDRQREELKSQQAERRVAIAEARELGKYYVTTGANNDINWEEVMITFMTEYADLIGQLKPNEKIVINQKSPQRQMVVIWNGKDATEKSENEGSNISAEVLRKDLTAFKSGKINRKEFIEKIKISKTEPERKIPDLEMFSSIFEKFYSYDLTESFYLPETPWYEVLNDFGVIFHVKAFSPNQSFNRVRYYTPGASASTSGSDQAEEKKRYGQFKEDIANFLLDYGRTIRSLGEDEKVLLDIKIEACRDCQVPKSMEVSIKVSTLTQYDQLKLSKDKALDQIEIKEVF